jgi:hypothetical protein
LNAVLPAYTAGAITPIVPALLFRAGYRRESVFHRFLTAIPFVFLERTVLDEVCAV